MDEKSLDSDSKFGLGELDPTFKVMIVGINCQIEAKFKVDCVNCVS